MFSFYIKQMQTVVNWLLLETTVITFGVGLLPCYWFKQRESTEHYTGQLSFITVSPWHLAVHSHPFCWVIVDKLGRDTTRRKLPRWRPRGPEAPEILCDPILSCPRSKHLASRRKKPTTAVREMKRHWGRNAERKGGCVKKNGLRQRKTWVKGMTEVNLCRGHMSRTSYTY